MNITRPAALLAPYRTLRFSWSYVSSDKTLVWSFISSTRSYYSLESSTWLISTELFSYYLLNFSLVSKGDVWMRVMEHLHSVGRRPWLGVYLSCIGFLRARRYNKDLSCRSDLKLSVLWTEWFLGNGSFCFSWNRLDQYRGPGTCDSVMW